MKLYYAGQIVQCENQIHLLNESKQQMKFHYTMIIEYLTDLSANICSPEDFSGQNQEAYAELLHSKQRTLLERIHSKHAANMSNMDNRLHFLYENLAHYRQLAEQQPAEFNSIQ